MDVGEHYGGAVLPSRLAEDGAALGERAIPGMETRPGHLAPQLPTEPV